MKTEHAKADSCIYFYVENKIIIPEKYDSTVTWHTIIKQ